MGIKREITAIGVIYKKLKTGVCFLLEKDIQDMWNIVSAPLDNEDDIDQRTKQIVLDRCGVEEVRIISDLGRLKYWFPDGEDLVHRRVYSFLFEIPQTSPDDPENDSSRSLKWFRPLDALNQMASKDTKLIVQKALEKLKIPVE